MTSPQTGPAADRPGRFVVRGARNGSLVTVTWDRGKLSGDFPTLDLVQVQAELVSASRDDARFGSYFASLHDLGDDPLADPDEAYRLIASVLETVRTVEGDVPPSAAQDRS